MTDPHGPTHAGEPTDDPGSGEGVDAELDGGLRIASDTARASAGGAGGSLELSPRTLAPPPQRSAAKRRQRRILVGGVLVVLLGAAGFLISQLGSATTYFYNADQAVAHKASLGSKTFRIQGTVVAKPVKLHADSGERLRFDIAFNGVNVPCDYSGGEPSSLFKAGEPVVLVGHFSGDRFKANQILVKHDATYKAKHPDRVSSDAP